MMATSGRKNGDSSAIVATISTRVLFALHSVIAIWCLVDYTKQPGHWLFVSMPFGLFVEATITMYIRYEDNARCCPCVFILLCSSLPPIWYLQLHLPPREFNLNDTRNWSPIYKEGSPSETVISALAQTLLLVLVFGRLLWPRPQLNADDLSQLIVHCLLCTSDIAQCFSILSHAPVYSQSNYAITVLSLWSLSLIQFVFLSSKPPDETPMVRDALALASPVITALPINMTQSDRSIDFRFKREWKDHNAPSAFATSGTESMFESQSASLTCSTTIYQRTENTWDCYRHFRSLHGIIFQDLPFLILRLYAMFHSHIFDHTILFFAAKNVLLCSAELYRFVCAVVEFRRATQLHGGNRSAVFNNTTITPSLRLSPSSSARRRRHCFGRSLTDTELRGRVTLASGKRRNERDTLACESEPAMLFADATPEGDEFSDLAYL